MQMIYANDSPDKTGSSIPEIMIINDEMNILLPFNRRERIDIWLTVFLQIYEFRKNTLPKKTKLSNLYIPFARSSFWTKLQNIVPKQQLKIKIHVNKKAWNNVRYCPPKVQQKIVWAIKYIHVVHNDSEYKGW